jgi:hypothetical protein
MDITLSERLMITVVTGVLAIGACYYTWRERFSLWWGLCISTFCLTACLLIYYQGWIHHPSHGMGIAILPLATWWLAWRRETTGKPAWTVPKFVLIQIAFTVLYVIVSHWQET